MERTINVMDRRLEVEAPTARETASARTDTCDEGCGPVVPLARGWPPRLPSLDIQPTGSHPQTAAPRNASPPRAALRAAASPPDRCRRRSLAPRALRRSRRLAAAGSETAAAASCAAASGDASSCLMYGIHIRGG